MLNHIGTNNITTSRLLLRKFKKEDSKEVFENWAKDPQNVKYLSWKAHETIDETKEIVAKWVNEYNDRKVYRWCITLKDSGEVIGGIDVVDLIEKTDCCEIGYVLSKKFWNKGIMTEALNSVLEYLFQKVGFHRIQAKHDINNPASGKVMAKCGMKKEGILRNSEKTNSNKWCDVAIYSILENEFKEENDE